MQASSLLGAFLAFVLWTVSTQAVLAHVITVHFKGTVDVFDAKLSPSVTMASTFSGYYRYDLPGIDLRPEDLEEARYRVIQTSLNLDGNPWEWNLGDPGWAYIGLTDFASPGPFQGEERYVAYGRSVNGPTLEGNSIYGFRILSASIFNKDQLSGVGLPDYVPFSPSDYTWTLYFNDSQNAGLLLQVQGSVTQIDAAPIPATPWLLGLGLAGLGLAVRRRKTAT